MELKQIEQNNVMDRNEKIPYYYTNGVEVSASPYDFALICKNRVTSNDQIFERELCDIIMSPQHAKAFSNILNNYIAAYEEKFGVINVLENGITRKVQE